MGIGLARFSDGQRRHARGRENPLPGEAGTGDQAIQPRLEAEPIGDEKIGARHLPLGFGIRFVFMRIAIGPDEIGKADLVSGDSSKEIGQNRESRHDLRRRFAARRFRR